LFLCQTTATTFFIAFVLFQHADLINKEINYLSYHNHVCIWIVNIVASIVVTVITIEIPTLTAVSPCCQFGKRHGVARCQALVAHEGSNSMALQLRYSMLCTVENHHFE
jgi:hypothetical protein